MAFKPKRKIFVLDFAGTDLDGLTVKAKSAPLGQFMEIGKMADAFESADDIEATMAALEAMLELFDEVLVGWDLVDDNDVEVPPTAAGLKTLDAEYVMQIITAWQTAVSAVPDPLPVASPGGSPSLVGSMPMEPLSPSLAS